MTIQKITTHSPLALERLLYQFKEAPKTIALLEMQTDQVQNLEDAAFEFLTKIPLQTATGIILDRWGVVLGEDRLGDNDTDYRARLFFAISKNLCNGTPEEMILFFNFLMLTTHVQIYEYFPGVIVFAAINASNFADPVLIKSQLQQLACAGVRVGWIVIGESPNPFAFLTYPYMDARGFDTYPTTGVGGEFTTVY